MHIHIINVYLKREIKLHNETIFKLFIKQDEYPEYINKNSKKSVPHRPDQ